MVLQITSLEHVPCKSQDAQAVLVWILRIASLNALPHSCSTDLEWETTATTNPASSMIPSSTTSTGLCTAWSSSWV